MNAAGPTSPMIAPEPTNSPAPMTPPIAIIARSRCRRPFLRVAPSSFPCAIVRSTSSALHHSGGDGSRRHRRDGRPPENSAVIVQRDESVIGEPPGVEGLPTGRLGLEGGLPGGDALRVDVPDRRPVVNGERDDDDVGGN